MYITLEEKNQKKELKNQKKERKREEAYRKKVIAAFFEYGKLKAMPVQQKKQRICWEEIAKSFELGVTYEEAEVNKKIKVYFEDYCTIRRNMISEKIIKREGTKYTRIQ